MEVPRIKKDRGWHILNSAVGTQNGNSSSNLTPAGNRWDAPYARPADPDLKNVWAIRKGGVQYEAQNHTDPD